MFPNLRCFLTFFFFNPQSPGEEDLHNDYTTAKHVGMVGADCASVYSECSKGILDSVLLEH